MKQLKISVTMGLLCIATWIIAAPVLTPKEIKREKEKVRLTSEAQTLTML
jgi:hypothetical protein